MGLLSKRTSVGIDITSQSVKLLALRQTASGYQVERIGIVPLNPNAVDHDTIKDVAAVTEAVRLLKARTATSMRFAHIALPSHAVIIKTLQLDSRFVGTDLEAQVALEVDRFIDAPMDEVSLDFEVRGPVADREGYQEVLVVATRAQRVETYVDILQEAGFSVKTVDVSLYALARASLWMLSDLNELHEETVAVFDIGAHLMTLSIFHHGEVIYTREESFGGQYITQLLKNHYDLSFEQAETLKIKQALPEKPELLTKAVLELIYQEVLLHITRQLQFFSATESQQTVGKVLLSGGSALITGLGDFLQTSLAIPVTVANPLENMSYGKSLDATALPLLAPRMMVCCGLAMRGFQHD